MRRAPLVLLALLSISPAAAQQEGAGGGGAGVRDNLRSYIVSNDSDKVITEVWLGSTDGGKELYSTKDQIRPNHTVNLRVARAECLAQVRVKFADGTDLRADDLNDCKLTRIAISNQKVELKTSVVQ